MSIIGLGLCFMVPHLSLAQSKDEAKCKATTEIRETRPAKADIAQIKKDVLALKDLKDRKVVEAISPEFEKQLKGLFEQDPEKISKLEQFYGLLYHLAAFKTLDERRIDFQPDLVKKLLLSSKVFSRPDLPNHIKAVRMFWSSYFKRASFEVDFDIPELKLPLNEGKGFSSFKEGLCQVAEALLFYGGFRFDVSQTSGENIFVQEFKNVDLYGKFGSRGTVDVDINYISLKSVEFLKGSPLGVVRAKVSKKEFEVNEHSWLLKMVTQLVTDKSTQAIDW